MSSTRVSTVQALQNVNIDVLEKACQRHNLPYQRGSNTEPLRIKLYDRVVDGVFSITPPNWRYPAVLEDAISGKIAADSDYLKNDGPNGLDFINQVYQAELWADAALHMGASVGSMERTDAGELCFAIDTF